MQITNEQPASSIELALAGLQEERSSCVRRLEAVLHSQGAQAEVEGYLRLIANINAALIRLAGAHELG